MKRAAIALLMSVCLSVPAMAGVAEGTAAYGRGDFAAAHREFLTDAKAGNARAQFSLGLMYLRGQGVARDPLTAMSWLRKAAGRGDGDARLVLGELHMREGPPIRDYVKSHMWLTLALARVRGPMRAAALDLRTRVAAKMTAEQLEQAKKLAADWQALEK